MNIKKLCRKSKIIPASPVTAKDSHTPKKTWINTHVIFEWDGSRFVETYAEGYEYQGPLALAHTNPSLDQDSFAFYNDGTEAGSTIIGSVNTNPTLDVDTTYLVRFLVQEAAGGTTTNTSVTLQYNHNSGGWNNVTTTSSVVKAVDSVNLTDGNNTTQRIGSGTFQSTNAGVIEDGTGGSVSFAGNDETEFLFPFQIVSGDVANNDTIQLQLVTLNTYTRTPSITVNEPLSDITVTPTAISLTGATAGSTVVQSSLTLTPTSISTTGSVVDPGALQGSISLTPAAITITGNIVNPAIIQGSVTYTPSAVNLISATTDPSIGGSDVVVTPTAIAAVGSIVNPTTLQESISLTLSPISLTGTLIDPTVIEESISIIPSGIDLYAQAVNPGVQDGSGSGIMVSSISVFIFTGFGGQ